ncbi:hypothetical protein HMN09_00747300 [Mycena chlorophos]|uniref:Uncharacterized protein n=1 Tax=Mycena chlorophos TaxID=658473 RepID=A0A8H6SUX0_MYCCL|nr:hypothetical protein HMN09_00747300 [Mycena chlorophos]
MLWTKRRKSRPEIHSTKSSLEPPSPTTPTASISRRSSLGNPGQRQPFAPLDVSPSMPDQHHAFLERRILTPAQQRMVAEEDRLYTTNSLDAFTFGSPSQAPASPVSRNIGPLDELDEDDRRTADDTPRQSLATGHGFYTQSASDAASHHTFGGTSSASSRSGSRSRASSTTHTSMDDLGGVTFNPLHHHPSTVAVEFDSEEELGEVDDYDNSIEVSSARGASSMDGAAFEALLERQMYTDERRASLTRPTSIPEGRDREGSLATLRQFDPQQQQLQQDDWQSLRRASLSRDSPGVVPVFAGDGPNVSGGGGGGYDSFGFDLDWTNMQGGITGLDMRDIAVHAARQSINSERRPSQLSLMLRRPSTASGSIMQDPDSFAAAVRGWGGEEYERQRKYWTFRRDMADGRGGTTSRRAQTSGSALGPVKSITSGRVAVDRPRPAAWKGMHLNSEEIWNSALVGSFKVRRIELRPQKPQQRVTVDPFRGPYTLGPKLPHDGAYTNIHKHSKVMAFSIHRHYKPTRAPPESPQHGRGSISGASGMRSPLLPNNIISEERRRPTAMILLAPRHVQEAYTSTNTTKGLRSHGLLDDRKEKERAAAGPMTKREKERERKLQTQSAGSVRSTTSTFREMGPPPPPVPQQPPLANHSDGDSGYTGSSFSPRSQSTSRRRRRRHSMDLEDSDSETERMRSRTTHNEAFSTMDASSIDQMVLAQDGRGDNANGVLSRVWRKAPTHPTGGFSAQHQVYSPPWVTLQSRVKQEERRRRHDVLSNSFEDVGLLPPKKSTSTRSTTSSRRTLVGKDRGKKDAEVDIFAQVPAESLFMLLPLWPGPTDPVSERLATREPHEIPTDQRQYLLVAYNPTDERPPLPDKKSRATRSTHSSPTSSGDAGTPSTNGRGGGCDILLTSFHVSARLVSHADLQGSGVRVPDEGLAVLGPWHEAWLSMPQIASRDHGLLVIGTCSSARDAGIEFDPEGLVKMGLCIPVPPEPGMGEEPVAELTPIGRAVLEMAWIGCVAVTSFGPAGSA